ncbi:SH3 domain-containing protein [Ureibacillus sp. NPDC094379]
MREIVLTIMLLVFGGAFAFHGDEANAAAPTEMYVNAKSDIILRAKPRQNAEQLGTIKNHSKVTVLSSSKGWSYVQSGEAKGFVYTVALTKKKPKATIQPVTGGLTPKEGLVLTYKPSFLNDQKETFIVEKDGEYSYLYNPDSPLYPHMPNFTYIENKKQILVGVANSDFIFIIADYPLKHGQYTKDYSQYSGERKVLVESTTKTIKVKAGTFKNVVILRFPDGSREYLARGIGIIKSTNKNGDTITELVSVK